MAKELLKIHDCEQSSHFVPKMNFLYYNYIVCCVAVTDLAELTLIFNVLTHVFVVLQLNYSNYMDF